MNRNQEQGIAISDYREFGRLRPSPNTCFVSGVVRQNSVRS